jgi:hypothetical protein
MTNLETQLTDPITKYPIKFLGATLLSMNSQMGWGVDSSTLNVELIEDCTPISGYNAFSEQIEFFGADNFIGKNTEIIGAAAYFSLPAPDSNYPEARFRFGGIIQNWNTSLGSNGITYKVSLKDPKDILDNILIVLDSYSDLPFQFTNYFNPYAAYEAGANYGNCTVFGTANSTERGMNYRSALRGLLALAYDAGDTNFRLTAYSPTALSVGEAAGVFKIDLGLELQTPVNVYNSNMLQNRVDSLPAGPSNYRIADKISFLEFINDICNLTGRNFYASLYYDFINQENIIKLSTVNLTQNANLNEITTAYSGLATEISYGRELRNEKNRKIIFGEQIHYLTYVDQFVPFFGEDSNGDPIYPLNNEDGIFLEPDGTTESSCGFWIYVDISKLQMTLSQLIQMGRVGPPRPGAAPSDPTGDPVTSVWLSELDIRSAMSSWEAWRLRAFCRKPTWWDASAQGLTHYSEVVGSLNYYLQRSRGYYDYQVDNLDAVVEALRRAGPEDPNAPWARGRAVQDVSLDSRAATVESAGYDVLENLSKIYNFVKNLGDTYYGKQFLTPLNNTVCVTRNNTEGEDGFGEKLYSVIPTNNGGWVDYGTSVLGLSDPSLGAFRLDDDRIKPFAMFTDLTSTNIEGGSPGLPENSGVVGQ